MTSTVLRGAGHYNIIKGHAQLLFSERRKGDMDGL